MSGGDAHDRRLRRRDPRAVAARVLNRASEGGAFDDLLDGVLSETDWFLGYGDEIRERASEMIGGKWPITFWRSDLVARKRRIHFRVDGLDGEER